jgi:outer membrane protein TolC
MSARMNYKLQKSDYKLNLVSNLDVLQAIQTAQDSKRALIHSVYDTKRLYWQLCAAVGEATMERLDDAFRPVN